MVLKAFADRPRDWIDIEGVLIRQGSALERSLVVAELHDLLLKEDLVPLDRLQTLLARHR